MDRVTAEVDRAIDAFMSSLAYWDASHVDHDEARRLVAELFELKFPRDPGE